MKKIWLLLLSGVGLLMLAGCATEKLPSEDLEVVTLYKEQITTLKNPKLPTNGKEKYEAAKYLIDHVDFSYTRNIDTVDNIFYYPDAYVDDPRKINHTITFNYRYENRYVRIIFYRYDNLVVRTDVIEK